MHVALVHGYFLSDSGSAIYVRELASELVRQGHEITLICQDQHPEEHGFIDSAYQLDPTNELPEQLYQRIPAGPGSCRLVRPFIGGSLLTYVAGPFPGFQATPFQDAESELIENYIQDNLRGLLTIFSNWPPDLVQANHLVMQPYLVRGALENCDLSGVPYAVTVHGSALNFTVKSDRRMAVYARTGLEKAATVATLSSASREDVVRYAASEGLDLEARTQVLPPGVDTGIFHPGYGRKNVLVEISREIDAARDDILVFVGRLLWTKGPQYAVAALPLMLEKRPRLRLLMVGAGPALRPLKALIEQLDSGDIEAASAFLASSSELRPGEGFGPVMPPPGSDGYREYQRCLDAVRGDLKHRVLFLGHLPHERLAPLFAAADLSLAPSVFPEAFGLVSVEAMAGGALPLATYQTGLKDPLDAVAGELGLPLLKALAPGTELTPSLADTAIKLLSSQLTSDAVFRGRLHELATRRFSWKAVAGRYLELAQPHGKP